MRILTTASVAALAALALAACQPAAEEPASAPAPQAEIQSTTAPSVGGPSELPTDGGVTPAPEAMEGASAEDVAAPASPAEAAVLSGGAQSPANR